MTQYIDKNALVAEIEKIIPSEPFPRTKETLYGAEKYGKREICFKILDLINTLEVKEVDLEKEINHWQGCEAFPEGANITPLPKAMDIVERTAKHFFELGLKVQKG